MALPEQESPLYSSTVTLAMPDSPVSWIPSASASFQTRSPMLASKYNPASTEVSFSPDVRVISPVHPESGSASLSRLSSEPWFCGLNLVTEGFTNFTEYVPGLKLVNEYVPYPSVDVVYTALPLQLAFAYSNTVTLANPGSDS